MTRLPRWVAIALGCLATLVVAASVAVYGLSERVLRRTYRVPAVAISIPTDPSSIIEGRRLATIRGCFGGCHGKQAEGRVMFDEPMIARLVAPNLTAAVRRYSDAELAVVIRNGVRPGGRSVIVMPSAAFIGLTDGDLGRIIAFLKSLPAVAGPGPSMSVGPLGRIGFAIGKFKTEAQLIADTVPPPGTTNKQAAYSPEEFTRLLRTGVALGGRNLGTMSPWARELLSHLTDAEIAALYSYLHGIAEASHN